MAYNLPPGTYALFCFVAGDMTGIPHALMGMHKVIQSDLIGTRGAARPGRPALHRLSAGTPPGPRRRARAKDRSG